MLERNITALLLVLCFPAVPVFARVLLQRPDEAKTGWRESHSELLLPLSFVLWLRWTVAHLLLLDACVAGCSRHGGEAGCVSEALFISGHAIHPSIPLKGKGTESTKHGSQQHKTHSIPSLLVLHFCIYFCVSSLLLSLFLSVHTHFLLSFFP